MKPFTVEADVRKWLKKNAPRVWWIESARGGTFGMPDALVAIAPQRWALIELKLVRLGAEGPGAVLSTEAHPGQRNVVRDLRAWGAEAWFCGGIAGTTELVWWGPEDMRRAAVNGAETGKRRAGARRELNGAKSTGRVRYELIRTSCRFDARDVFEVPTYRPKFSG